MQNRNQVLVGSLLILFGGGLLLATLLHISFWAICFPAGLILIGAFMLLGRSPGIGTTSASGVHFLGDIVRSGEWPVTNEEFWLFVGDVRLDMTRAQFPAGETTIRLNAFVTDVDVTVPSDVGVSVSATSFVTDAELNGQRAERFLSGVQLSTPNYATAERKLRLVTATFVSDVNVKVRPGEQAVVDSSAPQAA